jgi:hypothetical protein
MAAEDFDHKNRSLGKSPALAKTARMGHPTSKGKRN